MRINRYIASCTQYSRRAADEFVAAGDITINETVVTDHTYRIEPEDQVRFRGTLLVPNNLVYYVLNKPVGYVTTVRDRHAKKIVTSLVPPQPPVFPVGRLDKDSHGLLIMTNDGLLMQQITHPSYEHEKEYEVCLSHPLSADAQAKLLAGITLPEGIAVIDSLTEVSATTYRIVLHQGMNHQIRRMIGAVHNAVIDLKRVRIGAIQLGGIPEGKYVTMSHDTIYSLLQIVI